MGSSGVQLWAKTTEDGLPGISVRDHCVNVGCVAEAIMAGLPLVVRTLLPPGTVTLAALHDAGKITLGFQVKCPAWLARTDLPKFSPGETLRQTEFSAAFTAGREADFQPNPLQQAVADAAHLPGNVVVEGPMGCGKTEAALFAAQQLIASGQQQGIYFALPTRVTSHNRIERFLRNTLTGDAPLRSAEKRKSTRLLRPHRYDSTRH